MGKIGEIKAVIFDVDDTLVNSNKAEYNAICKFKDAYKEFNQGEYSEFAKLWKKITKDVYDKYLQHQISFEQLRIERMKNLFKHYKVNISDKEAMSIYSVYQNEYEKNWELFDDAKEILENFKNKYKLAIITNGDSNQQRKKIAYTGLNQYFSDIFISSEVGFSKPEKEIFQTACKKINLNPENCIMIGDRYKVDIEGSLNVGMHGIWVNRNKENITYKFQVEELNDINQYL